MTISHCGKLNLFRASHKNQSSTSQHHRCQPFSRWTARQHAPLIHRRSQPQENISQNPQDGKGSEEVSPQRVELDGKEVGLMMRRHGASCDPDHECWEGVE